MGEDVLLSLSRIRCGSDSNLDAVARTLVGGSFTVAYRCHGRAPSLGAVGSQLGRTSVACDELLKIVYHLERVLSGEPDDNQLDVWAVALRRGTRAGGEDITWREVAAATLYGMDPDRNALLGERPFDVADAYSADTAYYYEHVFDVDGDLLRDAREAFEWVEGRALFLHDVQVPRPLRRRGYGSLLAADAILTLASHGTAVFAHPGPTDLQSEDPEDVRRFRSETENTRFLGALGFVPFRDRLWVLDLSTRDALDTLARIRLGAAA